ncbi:DASH complex subunit dam1, partial [Cryomyces antarcticus]
MASTTPTTAHHTRTTSRNAPPPPHPTTPLRPPSRTSLRESSHKHTSNQQFGSSATSHPLDALEPAFAELSDSMADLEANFMHLQLLHESLSRFSENFAGFLYGLNMNAFCVDFPEAPVAESFRSARREEESYGARASAGGGGRRGAQQRFGLEEDGSNDPDATF